MDRRAAILKGDELYRFDRGRSELESTWERGESMGKVSEGTPVEILAQNIAADAVPTMARCSHTYTPALVRLVLDRGLVWLPAQAFFGIDVILPGDGWRDR
jgi:hypothetical protein